MGRQKMEDSIKRTMENSVPVWRGEEAVEIL
jgi:hypothetical protein